VVVRELDADATPGLLATLPPQVPVAIGDTATPSRPSETPTPNGRNAAEPLERLTAWRAAVDALLRHPQAAP